MVLHSDPEAMEDSPGNFDGARHVDSFDADDHLDLNGTVADLKRQIQLEAAKGTSR